MGSHGWALRGTGSWAPGTAGHGQPFPLAAGPGPLAGAAGSTAGPRRGCRPAAAGVRCGGDRGRLPTCSGQGCARPCWRNATCWAARLSRRRSCQASSSPGHRTCSACCGHRSTPSWSCRVGPAIPVLQRHGLRVLPRDPYSFTPLLEDRSPPRSLLLGHDTAQTQRQIAQFSRKDAEAYPKYEAFMGGLVSALDPLLDAVPVDTAALGRGSLLQRLRALQALQPLLQAGLALGRQLPRYYEVLTAPISKILDQWFESEPLKATLATDAVIGAMASPHTPGSGYVLLHHVMGELQGRRGAWGYVAGGMGALSQAIARAAAAQGAHIFAEKAVCHVLLGRDGRAQGIALQDGTEVRSKLVLSNASPQITFLELTPQEQLPKDFVQRIRQVDTCSPVTKINVAVDRLPSFLAAPNAHDGQPLPHHQCSIHLNCEGTHLLHQAFTEVTHGHPSSRPMIELCIPSALDPGLAPRGCHVVSLFTQYTPSVLAGGRHWDEQARNAYADTVFDCIEAYAPGFKASVIGRDILTPPDLERIFGLPGGNIFHGAMSLDQLYFARPVPSYSGYRSPVPGLYLCGSGAHPGGGVMGAAGRNAARVALEDFRRL
ncbi:pyridine nucleotide-disulfide oxidoreductase domain-containing protein 2 isoform X3 [Opisthocomus hoazin]|uniref:pyridine nucleotide-disulfide oxidoreductase domain-containing protein 2 isoform X3 n=1 Tax=Opisthocomus hoazin TaxID=30419 RepID=UPI003F532585